MAYRKELGIKYNDGQELSLDQLAYQALTYEEVETIPGSSKGWYKTFKNKTLMYLVDVVLDTYMKYGRDAIVKLISKTGLDKQTSYFILKIIEKFTLYFVEKNNYKQAKEETSDKMVASFSDFLSDEEKVNFAYTINNGTQEQVISEIQQSVKNKADELTQKWNIVHVDSTEKTDQADINETTIPSTIIEKTPDISKQETKKDNSDKKEDKTAIWVTIGISSTVILGFIIYLIYSNKKRRRR